MFSHQTNTLLIACLIASTLCINACIASPADLITQLDGQVAGHASGTDAEKLKKAVLELALERARNALAVSLDHEAQSLADDVANALSQSATGFLRRNPAAKNIAVLKPLTVIDNNPYVTALVQKTEGELSKADVAWPRATVGNPTFDVRAINGDHGSRKATELANSYFWLFAHEQSPMRFDPRLVKRCLRRLHAYIDALSIEPDFSGGRPVWYDGFAMEDAFPCIFEIKELHPGLLLPSQLAYWDKVINVLKKTAIDEDWATSDTDPWVWNIETSLKVAGLNIGYYCGDNAMVQAVKDHADEVIAYIRPDGAVPYRVNGNPSVNYHNELFYSLLKIYMQTGYDPIADALKASAWKGPVMGRTDEFYTSPFYKAYRWNISNSVEVGPEACTALSGNPYTRWMLDRSGGKGGRRARYNAPWYDNRVTGMALPDGYTIPDRNINGPRAWYGNFNYAGAFAPNPSDDSGRETLMGCMTVDEDGRLNSILADVTNRVWMEPSNGRKTSFCYPASKGNMSAWGYLTDNGTTKAATTISKNFSIGSSVHKMTAADGAYRGTEADWLGRQLWMGLPGRIVGLVSVVPAKDKAQAYAVNGVLRLISGGAAGAAVTKVLAQISPTHYRYGQLDIIVHGSTYNDLTFYEKEYRKAQYPATELVFNNGKTEMSEIGAKQSYPLNTHYQFVVEVRPTWVKPLVSAAMLGDHDVLGLEVVTEDRAMQAWLNTTAMDKEVALLRDRLPSGRDSYALSSGVLKNSTFNTTVPDSPITLSAGQHAVLVVSEHDGDHGNGWGSFENYINVTTQCETFR